MATTLNASSSSGLITTADTSTVLQLQTNGTAALTIDASANVGIGTATPTTMLQLTGSAAAGKDPTLTLNNTTASTGRNYQIISGDGGPLRIYDATAATERMRIDSSGNVGIGNSSPSRKLEVTAAGDVYALVETTGTTGTVGYLFGDSTSDAVGRIEYVHSADVMTFTTASTERMRIDSSGNLLVGTTSVGVGKLASYTSSNTLAAADFRSTASGDAGNRSIYISKFDNTTTTSQIFVQFAINNTAAGSGQINANGANAAAFGSYSDARLKENIVDLPPQLANIMALRPVEYDYIESEGGGHQIGFVAQEVQAIYPDLVGERADGMLTLSDMNKNDARLIKAIQEQQAIIQTLTDRITALEGTTP